MQPIKQIFLQIIWSILPKYLPKAELRFSKLHSHQQSMKCLFPHTLINTAYYQYLNFGSISLMDEKITHWLIVRWSIFLHILCVYPFISSVNCLFIAFIHFLLVYLSHWFVTCFCIFCIFIPLSFIYATNILTML